MLALTPMRTPAFRSLSPFARPGRGRGRALFARLALIGMLLATLAPGVSHWLARNDLAPLWQELCRQQAGIDRPAFLPAALLAANGIGPDPAPDTGPADGAGHRLDACGYCVLQAQLSNPPPANTANPVRDGSVFVPRHTLAVPAPRSAWAASLPRAPPGATPRRS